MSQTNVTKPKQVHFQSKDVRYLANLIPSGWTGNYVLSLT